MTDAESKTQSLRPRCVRWLAVAGAALAGLCVLQFGTYFWLAEDTNMPRDGITGLADYKCIYGCEFAAVDEKTWGRLSAGQRDSLERELGRHVKIIYHSFDAIPDSSKHFEPVTERDRQKYEETSKSPAASTETLARRRKEIESGRRMVGLKHGILFGWEIETRGLFWMKCQSRCYMGNVGEEHSYDLYIWLLGSWIRVWNYCRVMA